VTIPAARAAVLVVLATCGLLAVLQLAPERRGLTVSVYLLLLGAVALRLLLRAVQLAFTDPPPGPSELDAALVWRPAPPAPPPELEALRRTLVLASVSGVYAHERLRPELRSLAAELLAWRRGIDLDAEPEQARAVLGEAVWELLRPDRQAPNDHDAPGLPPALLERIVAGLEGVPQR
jgi:hypothetical protein